MKYAYYPGCAAESTAQDQHLALKAVAKALGIDIIEPKGWTCCGSTPAHNTNKLLSLSLPAANLMKAKEMGLDMIVSCAACYNRMKVANYEIQHKPEVREEVARTLGRDYDGTVKVKHFVEVLLEDIGLDTIKNQLTHTLNGLIAASYYGCLLVRPNEVTNFDDPENPTSMDRLIDMMGGESLDWPHKVECCGGGFALSRPDIVIELSASVLEMATISNAECISVACPMCQINLDLRQKDINKNKDTNYNLPVVYITQLLGLCLGISPKALGMNKSIVTPKPIIDRVSEVVV
jgi:heterodisulfide reductase subunit B2